MKLTDLLLPHFLMENQITINDLTESSVPKESSNSNYVGPSSQHTEPTELTNKIQFCVTKPPESCITFDIDLQFTITNKINP